MKILNQKRFASSSSKGFTLIELLVVVAIIGILSSVAVVSLSNARAKASAAKATGDLSQMMMAMELARADGTTISEGAAAGTLAANTCPADTNDTITGANGMVYIKLPCAGSVAYTAANPTNLATYSFSATFPDTGVFTCDFNGSCSCSSGNLCKQ